MQRIDEFIKKSGLVGKAELILQIHDELIYEVEDSEVSVLGLEIKKIMESVLTNDQSRGLPIATNASVGQNWNEMRELKF